VGEPDSDSSEVEARHAAFAFRQMEQDDSELDNDSEDDIGPGEAAAAFRRPVPGPYTPSSFTRFEDSWLDK
jgi:hypothetical protein